MLVIAIGLSLLVLYLIGMVVLVQLKGDTSIANFTWGGGVMLVTLYTFFTISSFLARQLLITLLIVLWAVRLIVYVYMRYTGKDPRFALWKWKGLKAFFINCGWVFGQAFMIAIMSWPAVLVNVSTIPGISYRDVIGTLVWACGFYFEALGDYQLFTFMRNPDNKGKVMSSGLWRYSRHPNYFGEVVMWWGIFVIALAVPYGWTAIIAPSTITFLILFVTGVPLVEKALADNPEYEEYKKETSMFIPWFVKKRA